MCGRYSIGGVGEFDPADFGLPRFPPDLVVRYNVAPSQMAPVVANRSERKLEFFRWGLVPFWAKDPRIGNRMINARAETLAEKPSFRNAFRKRRCLVLADGFYEWKREGRVKSPYHIRLQAGIPFAFAGLWEAWTPPEGPDLFTYAVVTTEPNPLMKTIHDRMPVILSPDAYSRWLDPEPCRPADLSDLLGPFPEDRMEAWPVSALVNSPENDLPECREPFSKGPIPLL